MSLNAESKFMSLMDGTDQRAAVQFNWLLTDGIDIEGWSVNSEQS